MIPLFLISCSAILIIAKADSGAYLHLTDFHYDWTHSLENADFSIGDPWTFIESAIQNIFINCPNPDFIIWTGDNIAYLSASQFNASKVVEVIGKMTNALTKKFPDAKLYPVLGNHDYSPENQLPDQPNFIYQEVGKLWSTWIGQQPTFAAYGYYKIKLSNSIILLGLNTNYYIERNKVTYQNGNDPGGQLAWMESELESAKNANLRAIIIGHVPPGAFGSIANTKSMIPKYNEPFLDIVTKYASVIIFMNFGHFHTDVFRVLMDSNKKPAVPILIAPAVLPGSYNNPSYRVLTYDRESYNIISYKQYYLNLSKTYELTSAQWQFEYEFPKIYSFPNMTAESMFDLQQKIVENGTLFNLYFELSSAKKLSNCSDKACKRMQLCALQFLRFSDYVWCMNQPSVCRNLRTTSSFDSSNKNSSSFSNKTHESVLIIELITLMLLLFLHLKCNGE